MILPKPNNPPIIARKTIMSRVIVCRQQKTMNISNVQKPISDIMVVSPKVGCLLSFEYHIIDGLECY